MCPLGSLGMSQKTDNAVEFSVVTVSQRTSEGATKAQNISCCYLTQCLGQLNNYNSSSYLSLQRFCEIPQ